MEGSVSERQSIHRHSGDKKSGVRRYAKLGAAGSSGSESEHRRHRHREKYVYSSSRETSQEPEAGLQTEPDSQQATEMRRSSSRRAKTHTQDRSDLEAPKEDAERKGRKPRALISCCKGESHTHRDGFR